MNSTLTPKSNPSSFEAAQEEDFNIGRYLEVLVANKWLIAFITLVVFLGGVVSALLERPDRKSVV